MTAFDIEWHETCIKNRRFAHERMLDEFNTMSRRLSRDKDEIRFYTAQILEAKRRGKKSFNPDRFLKEKND